MRAAPGPDVILTKESRNIKPRENIRHFLIAVAAVLSIGIILFTIITQGDKIQKNLSDLGSNLKLDYLAYRIASVFIPAPKSLSGNAVRMLNQPFTPLYFADLEYDPKTALIRQVKVGTLRGDSPRFLSSQPKSAPNKFIYKVEVLSSPKEILTSGWFTEYRDVVEEKDGKINFRVVVAFKPNSIIKVYLPNKKLLWTGQTNKKETII